MFLCSLTNLEAVQGKVRNAKYFFIIMPTILLFNSTMPCLESYYFTLISIVNKGMGKYKFTVIIQIRYTPKSELLKT